MLIDTNTTQSSEVMFQYIYFRANVCLRCVSLQTRQIFCYNTDNICPQGTCTVLESCAVDLYKL